MKEKWDLGLWLVMIAGQCVVLLGGCSDGSSVNPVTSPTSTVPQPDDVTLADAARCKVTLPNGHGPPGEVSSATYHGREKLFTVLGEDGVIVAQPQDILPDGTIAIKFPWWAAGPEGSLTIRGRRLDERGPPLRAEITRSTPETAFRGTGFWATSVIFSSEGCWEVTGSVDHSTLRFVTFVVET